MMNAPPEKAEWIVAALNQQLAHWRVGMFDPGYLFITSGTETPPRASPRQQPRL